ncbi:MAG: flagellar basal-body MS-ring/collar protein FliF [Vitreimonas sp.]
MGLGAWYYFALRDEYTVLYSDLRPNDASAIAADLHQRGIRYQLAQNGRQILVAASQLDNARQTTDAAGAAPHAIEGFELFDQSDMGLNEFAERIRYQRAIQGELERTIMMMDGVVSARVHISIPDRTPFRGEQQPAGAAVTLVMRTPQDETPARVEGIQRLVSAAVTSLTAADVVVLNGRGEVLSPRVEITDISATLLGGDGQTRRTAIDLVTQVMRRALPDRQFEVTIEQAAAPSVSTASASSAGAEPAIFTRIIKVASETALTDLEKERVRASLHNAGLVDGSLEQTVLFSVGLSSDMATEQRPDSVGAGAANAASSTRSSPSEPGLSLLMWAVFLALGAASVALVTLMYRRRRKPLSSEEHEKFADRLRQAFNAEGVDAA